MSGAFSSDKINEYLKAPPLIFFWMYRNMG